MVAAVSITDLVYTYPGHDKPDLNVDDLTIEGGEFCCIVGPNGAGKTTLCRVLAGLIPHFYQGQMAGSVKIHGQETTDTTISDLAGTVGLVMDDPFDQLTSATYSVRQEIAFGLQNIGMPAPEILETVEQVLEELDIVALADRIPTTLSGGEQQRVAIASTFARRPQVLVLDEATSQLDPQGCKDIFRLVEHFKAAGKTVIMVELNIDSILQHADRLIVIHNGQIVANGSLRHVLDQDILELIGVGLPSYPALAKSLRTKGLYRGALPASLQEAADMVDEVIHGHH